jgi:DNA-binding LacI/PurR family transcriptional regulator
MLLERMTGRDSSPRKVVLPVTLIVRRSSGAAGGTAEPSRSTRKAG